MIIQKHFDPNFKFCASVQLLPILLPKLALFSSVYREEWEYVRNPYIQPFGFVPHSDDAENLVFWC
jgi:hypothetical protein